MGDVLGRKQRIKNDDWIQALAKIEKLVQKKELDRLAEKTAGEDTDTEPETEPETVTIGTVNVRSDTYLNLRSGSGLEHSVIGHLLRGTEVEVVGPTRKS